MKFSLPKISDVKDWLSQDLSNERKKDLIIIIILIGFIVGSAYHYWHGVFNHEEWPRNTFLFHPILRFSDFTYWYRTCDSIKLRAHWEGFILPPFLYLFGKAWTIFGANGESEALILFEGIFVVTFMAITSKFIYTRDSYRSITQVIVFSLFSYPVLFSIGNANPESYVFLLLMGFVYYYHSKPTLSTALLAIAAAMKGIPIIFAALIIARKDYRRLLPLVGIVAILEIISLPLFIGSENNLHVWLQDIQKWHHTILIDDEGMYMSHSLYNLWKLCYIFVGPKGSGYEPGLEVLTKVYTFSSIVTFLVVLTFLWRTRLPLWKQLTLIVCCYGLLPQSSYDYKLLLLFIPLFYFFNSKERDKYSTIYTIIFGLLLIPKHYLAFKLHHPMVSQPRSADEYQFPITLTEVLTPILLTILGLLIVATHKSAKGTLKQSVPGIDLGTETPQDASTLTEKHL